MNLERTVCFLLAGIILSGCTSKYASMKFVTEPGGAALFEGDKYVGDSPVTLTYEKSADFQSGKCMAVPAVNAVWASGARTNYGPDELCPKKDGWTWTIQRPDFPNLKRDLDVAVEVAVARLKQKIEAAQEAQARACQTAAIFKGLGAMTQSNSRYLGAAAVEPPRLPGRRATLRRLSAHSARLNRRVRLHRSRCTEGQAMKSVAVAMQKGGSGKTTTAVTLAAALAEMVAQLGAA